MATADLVRAYLDWQSEMGTEEVILPHPLIRAQPKAMSTEVSLRVTGVVPANSEVHPPGNAPAGLFESLSQALAGTADTKRPEAPAESIAARAGKLSDTAHLPVFMGLPDFWEYMERHPNLLQGEVGPVMSPGDAPVSRVIRGFGPAKAPLALVGFDPAESDAAEGKPFQAEAGALLEKMMRAIRMEMAGLYLSNLIKIRIADKAWSRRELARIVPLLHIELGLAQTPMVLLLGLEAAQTVLKTGKTLEELRQETHRMEGREFYVTYHPQELLRKEELKRKAWEDLQWLQRRMAEAQART